MKNYTYLILFVFTTFVFGCTDDPITIDNTVSAPATYEFVRDGVSTVSFTGQTERILMATELISAMKDPTQTDVSLLEMYNNESATGDDVSPFNNADLNNSTRSIRGKVAASNDFFASNTVESVQRKQDFEDLIRAQVEEVYPNWNELASPGVAGQIADGSSVRYVNGGGLEYDQAVNKGLIGALMADQMINNYLSPDFLDSGSNRIDNDNEVARNDNGTDTQMEHFWDEAYGYLYGTAQDVTNPTPTVGDDDAFLNKYLGRVEGDSDFAGIADDIFEAITLGRAAIVAKNYEVRDQQSAELRRLISTVIAVRAVYYLQQGKIQLPTEGNNYGPTFHDLSEGFGFVYSLRFTRNPETGASYFSAGEVDGFIDQLVAGNGFWDVTPATLDEISEAIAARFDFTVDMAAQVN
jgi:hypothetical protein